MKKARHYWELAAMLGHVRSRYNLGAYEYNERNMDRALEHLMIAAGVGHDKSLKQIKHLFMKSHATKDDYGTALRAHQSYLDEVKMIRGMKLLHIVRFTNTIREQCLSSAIKSLKTEKTSLCIIHPSIRTPIY